MLRFRNIGPVLTLVAVFVAVTAYAQTAVAQTTPPVTKEPGISLPRVYQKWLQEDVRYIITTDERIEFEGFTTDTDRDRFIEQFWLRRDPTPGTAENEFKEEHYRRIAYSNVHFADRRPGWLSDRGHAYILYGPPDSIEQRPAVQIKDVADIDVAPVTIWHYRTPKAGRTDFTFTDECKCGEYRLLRRGEYWPLRKQPR